MDSEEREHIYRQFEKRHISVIIASLLLILAGCADLFFGIVNAAAPFLTAVGGITLTISGLLLIAAGIWSISFSRKRKLDFASLELLVCEKKTIYVCAWFIYFTGLVLILFSFILACADEASCLIAALSGLALLFSGMLFFSSYRNRRIMIHGNQIMGATILGRTYSYSKSEIRDIRFALATGGYKIFGNDNKKLFQFETNMKNADKLFAALDGSSYCDFTESVTETRHQLQKT